MDEVKKCALKFLRENTVAALSTSNGELSRVATVYYDIDDDFTFYFVTSKDSDKMKNIEKNRHVAIAVGFGPELVTVQAGGRAEIDEEEVYFRILKKIGFSNISKWPISYIAHGGFVALKVKPTWMKFLNLEDSICPGVCEKKFYKII